MGARPLHTTGRRHNVADQHARDRLARGEPAPRLRHSRQLDEAVRACEADGPARALPARRLRREPVRTRPDAHALVLGARVERNRRRELNLE